jgi:hypothetical protein
MEENDRKVLGVRKLQRVGYSTLTVSLPREWVQRQQLQAGDHVTIMAAPGGGLYIEKAVGRDSELSCTACGATIPSDSRFCKECGKGIGQ